MSSDSNPLPTTYRIVPIRRADDIDGFQLVVGPGGPGNSRYFASRRLGGAGRAREAAESLALDLGLVRPTRRRARRPAEDRGIRFMWRDGPLGTVLHVVASWSDAKGVQRQTSYSLARNGLEGALDRAIEARISAGAPRPDRAMLLAELVEFHAGHGDDRA